MTSRCKICVGKGNYESQLRTGYRKHYVETHRQLYSHAVGKCVKKLWRKILVHYGNDPPKCSICGETRESFLCIDHINGCGKEQRQNQGTGTAFYYWLFQNNFPEGYRILCHNCNMNVIKYDAKNEKQKKTRDNIKFSVMATYSKGEPICNCCGEKRLKCLTIDHINGGGNEHRREIKRRCGIRFYQWLKKNHFPEGFQVLCYNCNMGKQANQGICPHKLKSC